jgi:hypothetical protein
MSARTPKSARQRVRLFGGVGAALCSALLASSLAAAERIGNISDADPPGIEIRINRGGTASAIGPGGRVDVGDLLSIKAWCRKHKINSLVVINTRFGRKTLSCDHDEIIFTDAGPTPPPPIRSIPTITSEISPLLQQLKEVGRRTTSQDVYFGGPEGPEFHRPSGDTYSSTRPPRMTTTPWTPESDEFHRRQAMIQLCTQIREKRTLLFRESGLCLTGVKDARCLYQREEDVPLSDEASSAIESVAEAARTYCARSRR